MSPSFLIADGDVSAQGFFGGKVRFIKQRPSLATFLAAISTATAVAVAAIAIAL
jgi:hypothetical protein